MSSVGGFAIAIVLLATSASAQSRMSGFGSAHFGSRAILARHHQPFFPGYRYYGLPFWYSDYEPSEAEYVAPGSPPNRVPATQVKVDPVPGPELLELRDGQWVRVAAFSGPSGQVLNTGPVPQQVPANPLPPAVLVFRDGHTEEVSSYSIIAEKIYIKTDYWTSGSWTRAVPISSLDIPATLKQNQARGLKFELPSGPNEVMIRP